MKSIRLTPKIGIAAAAVVAAGGMMLLGNTDPPTPAVSTPAPASVAVTTPPTTIDIAHNQWTREECLTVSNNLDRDAAIAQAGLTGAVGDTTAVERVNQEGAALKAHC
jgi:hypothetical protein